MPAPTWATRPQLKFLTSRLPAFSKAQEDKSLPSFWTEIYRDFFAQWPDAAAEALSINDSDGEDSDSGSKKKKKKKKKERTGKENGGMSPTSTLSLEDWVVLRRTSVYNWYNNHNLNKGSRRAGKVNSVTVVLQPSVSRVSSEHHLYSKRYYETRVKADVEKEIGDQRIEPGKKLAIINKHLQQKYSNESDDIKQEIRDAIEQERKEKEAEKEKIEAITNGTEDLTPEQYMIAQSVAPDMIKDFMETMSRRTGWAFSMLAGGPSPSHDGSIRTIALHSGMNVHGLSYAKYLPNHHKKFVAPYNTFLQTVYPMAPNDTRFKLNDTEESGNGNGVNTKKGSTTLPTQEVSGGVDGIGSDETKGIEAGGKKGDVGKVGDGMVDSEESVIKTNLPSQSSIVVPTTQNTNTNIPSDALNTSTTLLQQPVDNNSFPNYEFPATATNESMGVNLNVDFMSNDVFNPEVAVNMVSDADWAAIQEFINQGRIQDNPNQTAAQTLATTSDSPFLAQNDPINQPISGLLSTSLTSDPSLFATGIAGNTPMFGLTARTNLSAAMSGPTLLPSTATSPPLSATASTGNNNLNEMSVGSETGRGEEDVNNEKYGRSGTGRKRKAPTSKEVVPLTSKLASNGPQEWLTQAKGYLAEGLDNEDWKKCLESWETFETNIGLDGVTAHRLAVRLRPSVLSKWMASRNYNKIPEIEDLKSFAEDWLKWWNSIQPEWRQNNDTGPVLPLAPDPTDARDMSCIRKGGPSGLVTILTGLKWWSESPSTKDLWLLAVKDLIGCFDLLKTDRKGNEEEDEGKGKGKGRGKKRKTG